MTDNLEIGDFVRYRSRDFRPFGCAPGIWAVTTVEDDMMIQLKYAHGPGLDQRVHWTMSTAIEKVPDMVYLALAAEDFPNKLLDHD